MAYIALVLMWFVVGCAAGVAGTFLVPLADLLPPLVVGMVVHSAYLKTSYAEPFVLRRRLLALVAALLGLCANLLWRHMPYEEIAIRAGMLAAAFIGSLMLAGAYRQMR